MSLASQSVPLLDLLRHTCEWLLQPGASGRVRAFAASAAPRGEVVRGHTADLKGVLTARVCRAEAGVIITAPGVLCVARALAALRAEAGVVVEGCDLEELSPVPGGLLCEFVLTVICPWEVDSAQTDPDSTSQVSAPCGCSLTQCSKSPWGQYFKDSDLEFY